MLATVEETVKGTLPPFNQGTVGINVMPLGSQKVSVARDKIPILIIPTGVLELGYMIVELQGESFCGRTMYRSRSCSRTAAIACLVGHLPLVFSRTSGNKACQRLVSDQIRPATSRNLMFSGKLNG